MCRVVNRVVGVECEVSNSKKQNAFHLLSSDVSTPLTAYNGAPTHARTHIIRSGRNNNNNRTVVIMMMLTMRMLLLLLLMMMIMMITKIIIDYNNYYDTVQ